MPIFYAPLKKKHGGPGHIKIHAIDLPTAKELVDVDTNGGCKSVYSDFEKLSMEDRGGIHEIYQRDYDEDDL